jgi:hypothetical protein
MRPRYKSPPPRFQLPFCKSALPGKLCINSQSTVWFSKCLQLSVSASLETVFRNQLVSKKQSLRGKVFANSFPRDGPHVTIQNYGDCPIVKILSEAHGHGRLNRNQVRNPPLSSTGEAECDTSANLAYIRNRWL